MPGCLCIVVQSSSRPCSNVRAKLQVTEQGSSRSRGDARTLIPSTVQNTMVMGGMLTASNTSPMPAMSAPAQSMATSQEGRSNEGARHAWS